LGRLSKLVILAVIAVILLGACGGRVITPPEAINAPQIAQTTHSLSSTAPSQPTPTVASARLRGLDFDAFMEESYGRLLRRDPETVLELGLAQVYNVATDQLTDISDEYIRQTQALESEILNALQQFDRSALTSEQQLTFDIYSWYLSDRVNGHVFMYDNYPVNPTVFSVHLDLLQFFTDLRPLTNAKEAQDYVTCLTQVKAKFEQLIDGLERREANGAMLPRFLVSWLLGYLNDFAESNARSIPYYTAFESKLMALTNVSESEKQSLLIAAEEAINLSVIPAYRSLAEYFVHLQNTSTNDAGVWKFPDGEAYYAYILRHYTSTDLTADQVHESGLQALERIHEEMRTIFDQLGYPQDEDLPKLYARVAADDGNLSGDEIVQGYETILSAVDQYLDEVFDLRPSIGVIVVGGPTGRYYIAPAVDGSRPGMFYAQDTGIQPKFSMPTLAYHEAIPGHHFQIAISQQLDLPSFRRGSDFTAYVEGWALYAEHLAAELGVYADDPYGYLGCLQARAFRAARLVVDTGIHARHWTFDQAVEFMVENTGMPEYSMQGEVSRYISVPGQATAYFIGYTKLLEMRQRVMDELGEQFNLKEFHNLTLGSGAMPLAIFVQVVNSYIQSKLAGE